MKLNRRLSSLRAPLAPQSIRRAGGAVVASLGMALLVGGTVLPSAAEAGVLDFFSTDSVSSDADDGTTGSSEETSAGTTTEETTGTEEASNGDDTGSSEFDNGFQGMGPAELAGEKGGGCAIVSQSSAVFAMFLLGGTAGILRRRES